MGGRQGLPFLVDFLMSRKDLILILLVFDK
jgi:hypothetical protein